MTDDDASIPPLRSGDLTSLLPRGVFLDTCHFLLKRE